jgi:hypothetical protein
MVTGPPETCCVRRAPTCPIARVPEQRTGVPRIAGYVPVLTGSETIPANVS